MSRIVVEGIGFNWPGYGITPDMPEFSYVIEAGRSVCRDRNGREIDPQMAGALIGAQIPFGLTDGLLVSARREDC